MRRLCNRTKIYRFGLTNKDKAKKFDNKLQLGRLKISYISF